MSEATLLSILFLGELAMVATGLAIYLFLRNRRITQHFKAAKTVLDHYYWKKTKDDVQYANYLQQHIDDTKEKLTSIPPKQVRALQARLVFLRAEARAQKEVENSDAFWNHLINDLDGLLLDETINEVAKNVAKDIGSDDSDVFNELDAIDISRNIDNIPTLEKHVSQGESTPQTSFARQRKRQ